MNNKITYNKVGDYYLPNLTLEESIDILKDKNIQIGVNPFILTTLDELIEEYEENKSYAMKALKKVMRPELINRLDNISVFHALTRKDVEKIFDNLIDDLKRRIASKGIGLKVSAEAKEYLINKGYDPKNGARPMRRCIEDEVESLLSEGIISEEFVKGDIPELKLVRGKLKLVK